LVALYSPLVYHWCRRMRLPEQEMPDVFQQVFQSVASHIEDFRKEKPDDTFRGWLRVITRNKVRDHFRRRAKQPDAAGGTDAQLRFSQLADPFSVGPAEAEAPPDPEEDHVYSEVLRAAMNTVRQRFQPRTWRAFWLTVVDGKTPTEAGEILNMRSGTVRVAKSRVLATLREELGESLNEPLSENR
jgi:RNA polymerase sigma-70 factor (ECF subfamily)